ncbi:hypothetical protein BpHYR1_029922 [Brachionus plicatilis]|uniref:Uncharacterized protein n=1 Tax=Brachionus plicatilis TaxID=10195 RepID=A0A3M7Q7G3_BRAPC|nr:hypothetical protein BpHYR1_029922 [Brachionus plicatilis]
MFVKIKEILILKYSIREKFDLVGKTKGKKKIFNYPNKIQWVGISFKGATNFVIKSPLKNPNLNPFKLTWNELKQHVRKRMILSEADAEMSVISDIERYGDWSNL